MQPGYSGSPVFDEETGRIVGLLSTAPPGHAAERDSYAIGAERLASAWPEVFSAQSSRAGGGAALIEASAWPTILHLSDIQFGRPYVFGGQGLVGDDLAGSALFTGLHEDLSFLATEHGLRPDLMVVTGGLTASGAPREFRDAIVFLNALCEAVELPKHRVAIVPGNHDVNRKACEAYFTDQESKEETPIPPYWPKWHQFSKALTSFYGKEVFTPDEPWTLFAMPDLAIVVAGLNSTWAQTHRDADDHGLVGEEQLRWFADRLANYQTWLRLAAVHHSVAPQAVREGERLRDASRLDELLGQSGLVSLLLHGHADSGRPVQLASGLQALSAGSPALDDAISPDQGPNQYQVISLRATGHRQHARRYNVRTRSWAGDTGISPDRSQWHCDHRHYLNVSTGRRDERRSAVEETDAERDAYPRESSSTPDRFLDRVADATRVSFPMAAVTTRPENAYLRVSIPLPSGGAELWPVGVCEGASIEEALTSFLSQVHARFASADPSVRSEFVYAGPPVPGHLVIRARQAGVRLRSFIEYQGLIDLRPLADRQSERLANDRLYPADLYVPQRYRLAEDQAPEPYEGLVEQATAWLSADTARLVMVLGDFGRGKTSFLRQLARTLPGELPGLLPILVELRRLEKAPSLDELLTQHLVSQGVEDINPAKLRYMVSSGRLALLFDGFDELELRVGYANAADYLQVLLESVSGQAKVVLTSRTQHFLSTSQVWTALGERVHRAASRIAILEDFTDDQIMEFLTKLYAGDMPRATARFALLADIHDLLGLARNPRMLAFIAALDETRLRDIQAEHGQISAAELYREIIAYWLAEESKRQQHRRGLPSLDEKERLTACTTLALQSWLAASPVIAMADLSAGVSSTLGQLSERGFSTEQATHAIGSGSLLVRTDEGSFAFVHQSIMEWLVANVARAPSDPDATQILSMRPMSRLMVDFFIDLAGPDQAQRWADHALSDAGATAAAKQNALAVNGRLSQTGRLAQRADRIEWMDLAGVDLRGEDVTDRNLRNANLRNANLRGMKLAGTDLSDADLRGADLTECRMVGGSLRGAALAESNWNRARLLGTEISEDQATSVELAAVAIVPRQRPDLMISGRWASQCVAFSPDGAFLAAGSGWTIEIIDLSENMPIRILQGHAGHVREVTFSPDGSLLATASGDGTARIWDAVSGAVRTTLQGHVSGVNGVAFSSDGLLLATASSDGTARIWDAVSGAVRRTLRGHIGWVQGVAFSPDRLLLATAADDNTAWIWDAATGAVRSTLRGHTARIRGVVFSPDGLLLATAADDNTARIWDTAGGVVRTTLQGHTGRVYGVAFSPDGSLLATASSDGTARIWDAATGAVRSALRVQGVAFSPDGLLLATASGDGTAGIWDVETGAVRGALRGHTARVQGVAFSPDGLLLATASDDGTARIWAAGTGVVRSTLQGHAGRVYGVAFSPDGMLLATASDDHTARIWDTAGGVARTTLQGHTGRVYGVAFSPDGSLLATASEDRTARIWDLANTAPGRIRRLKKHTGFAVMQGHANAVYGVVFSPDGSLLVTASSDGTARIWEVATGMVRRTLRGHIGWVQGAAFSPDGSLLATASGDGTARIWDAATGAVRSSVQGHAGGINSIAFSADGALLATGSDDGTTRIWAATTGRQLVALVALAGGGNAAIGGTGYKLDGDLAGSFWWAIKLCRFEPGELDPYVPELRRLPADARILPGAI